MALELYRRHPHVPASLILASAYAGWAGSLSPEETAARLEGVLAAADLPLEEVLEAFPGVLSAGAPSGLLEELTVMWADNTGSRKPGGYRAMAHSMAEADLRDVLPRIEVPTLLLYGELDQRSPLKVANELNQRIPSSQLVVIEGVGHSANVEAPRSSTRTCGRSSGRSFGAHDPWTAVHMVSAPPPGCPILRVPPAVPRRSSPRRPKRRTSRRPSFGRLRRARLRVYGGQSALSHLSCHPASL